MSLRRQDSLLLCCVALSKEKEKEEEKDKEEEKKKKKTDIVCVPHVYLRKRPGPYRCSHFLKLCLHYRALACVAEHRRVPRFLFRQPVRSVSGQLVLPWW